MSKTYSDTYLYNKFPYEEKLFKFLMTANQISTVDEKFEDIKYEDIMKDRQVAEMERIFWQDRVH